MIFQFSESGNLFACYSRDSFDSWFTIFAFFEKNVIHQSTVERIQDRFLAEFNDFRVAGFSLDQIP